ncbi:MAG: hypothetical protein ACREJM_15305, partial [Candidatus Saccharimonadales bacterium]
MRESGLNLFQRLARRWEAVHPYNAAQVLRISGTLDPSAAAQTWGESLRALGLGRVRVSDGSRFRYELLNGELARYPLRGLPADASLQTHLTAELNRPFDDPDEPPFRPFLLQTTEDFYFGVAYQHWVADSVSIRQIMREWFTRLFDPPAVRGTLPRRPTGGYWRTFANRGGWRLDETLLANFRSHMRHRRVRKVASIGPQHYPLRVTLHESPPGLVDRLRAVARARRLKVHDLLLAATAEACDRFVPAQRRHNRPDLSVSSVVDLRPHATTNLRDAFGLFLGFTNVICRPPDLRDWERLLQSVAAQNSTHKQTGLAQASMLWMAAALAVNPLVPDKNIYSFYRKELPMSGGLSNVNLIDTWAARYHPQPLREYLRVSPTGPLVPL